MVVFSFRCIQGPHWISGNVEKIQNNIYLFLTLLYYFPMHAISIAMSTYIAEADLRYYKSATVIILLQCFGCSLFLIEIFNVKSAVI